MFLTFDDEINTGGSIIAAAEALQANGARDVYSCVTHALFSGECLPTGW